MQFLITAIFAVILFVGVVSSCPSVCSCTSNSNGVNVDCSSRGLDRIPTDLPSNTYDFYLYDNNITSIKSDMFNSLTNLKYLDLGINNISVIEDNTFSNLPNLQNLYLDSNDIPVIEDNTFSNLPSLQNLYLNINQITSIKSDMFNNLTNLRYLNLDNNKITSIKSDAFSNLTNLNLLYLRGNPIAFVSESAFVNLPKLTSLDFDMYCGGCKNIPFWRWLRNQTTTSVTCNDYDGKSLAILEPNNFTDCFNR